MSDIARLSYGGGSGLNTTGLVSVNVSPRQSIHIRGLSGN